MGPARAPPSGFLEVPVNITGSGLLLSLGVSWWSHRRNGRLPQPRVTDFVYHLLPTDSFLNNPGARRLPGRDGGDRVWAGTLRQLPSWHGEYQDSAC